MKKFLCTFLSLLMILSLAIVPTFADDTTDTTIGYSADLVEKLTDQEMEAIPRLSTVMKPKDATTNDFKSFDKSLYELNWGGAGGFKTSTKWKIEDYRDMVALSVFSKWSTDTAYNYYTSTPVTFYLANDIDMSPVSDVWEPIGNSTEIMTGTVYPCFGAIFDGQGYAIKNLNMTKDENDGTYVNVGLFGKLYMATVKNLVIDSSCSFTYTGELPTARTAAVAAFTYRGSTITNVQNNAKVSANGGAVAGILADMEANNSKFSYLTNCTNNGDVTATGTAYKLVDGSQTVAASAGGIAGYGTRMNIEIANCVNTGKITAAGYAGGIKAGTHYDTRTDYYKITNCENSGAVEGLIAGGIVGNYDCSSAQIQDCSNTGKVTTTDATNGAAAQICAEFSVAAGAGNVANNTEAVNTVSIIGYQKQIVDANATNRSVRLVGKLTATEAELANYAKVGLTITATYKVGDKTVVKELKGESTSVYKALNAIDGGVNSDPTEITCGDGEYFFAVVLKNIPISIGEIELQVTPYSIDANDTVVNGLTGNATVDVADNAING